MHSWMGRAAMYHTRVSGSIGTSQMSVHVARNPADRPDVGERVQRRYHVAGVSVVDEAPAVDHAVYPDDVAADVWSPLVELGVNAGL